MRQAETHLKCNFLPSKDSKFAKGRRHIGGSGAYYHGEEEIAVTRDGTSRAALFPY